MLSMLLVFHLNVLCSFLQPFGQVNASTHWVQPLRQHISNEGSSTSCSADSWHREASMESPFNPNAPESCPLELPGVHHLLHGPWND
jgi:hypothetical protein